MTESLDPESFTPLYLQVAQILKRGIGRGEYRQGERLPSEKDLVERFGISRITATAALDELVKGQLAYRERGRGTFVARPLIGDFSFFSSFSEDMRARGLTPGSRLLSFEKQAPDETTREKLRMPEKDDYLCLTRVRLANNDPVVFQRAYLPEELYPEASRIDFANSSLIETMRSVYGYKPTWAEAIVEAGRAAAEETRALEIRPGEPILIIWHLTLDERYQALEYVYSVYRSDRFSFATGRNPLRIFR